MTSRHFAVIGCGTGGLATALFLARDGHRVTLFERYAEPTAVGAGILLQPTGMAVLRDLGLLDQLERRCDRVDALDGRASGGRRVMNVRYTDLAPDTYALGVHRANLLQVLLTAAAGLDIHCGSEVERVLPTGDRTALVLANGERHEGFDGLVIANGTQSRLRSQLDIPQSSTPYPWGALWSICPAPEELRQPMLQQRYAGASVMIGIMPTGRNPATGEPCVSFFWSLKTADHALWNRTPFDDWKTEVLGHWPEIEPVLASIGSRKQLLLATYADVRMRCWHAGRMAVLGDAAHGMSPQLGQGTNLALVDAMVLASCLRRHPDIPSAFAAYSNQRRRHLRFYQFASRWLTPLFQSDSRVAAWLRDLGFPLTPRLRFTRQEAVRTVAGLKTGLAFDRPLMTLDREEAVSTSA